MGRFVLSLVPRAEPTVARKKAAVEEGLRPLRQRLAHILVDQEAQRETTDAAHLLSHFSLF